MALGLILPPEARRSSLLPHGNGERLTAVAEGKPSWPYSSSSSHGRHICHARSSSPTAHWHSSSRPWPPRSVVSTASAPLRRLILDVRRMRRDPSRTDGHAWRHLSDWKNSHVTRTRADEGGSRILFDDMGNPSDRTTHQEHPEPGPWRKLERDRYESQRKVDVGAPADELRNLICNAQHRRTLARITRCFNRLKDVHAAGIPIRVKRLTKTRDALASLQPSSNNTADVPTAQGLAQKSLDIARFPAVLGSGQRTKSTQNGGIR